MKRRQPSCTEVVVIVDRSGSMSSLKDEAQGGLNTFLEEQRKSKHKVLVTLAQFDDHYELLYNGLAAKETPPYQLEPRGMTALYDAIGKTLTSVKERQEKESYAGLTLVAIVTDGAENHSREWSGERTKSLIAARKADGWQFVFLAADESAIGQGVYLGTMTFDTQRVGYVCTWNANAQALRGMSSGQSTDYAASMATSLGQDAVNKDDLDQGGQD